MSMTLQRTEVHMDTAVTVGVVCETPDERCETALERAFGRFREVEVCCSRFDPGSEVRRLPSAAGKPVEVSPILFGAVRCACAVARSSGGAFDPTVGLAQEARGFTRNHRTGRTEPSGLPAPGGRNGYRDVVLDARRRTVTLRRPLLLDLGAVAKGLAIDLAVAELAGFAGGFVEAGGDLAVRGRTEAGEAWRVGIRHPRQPGALCTVVDLSVGAVCTSGDYERPATDGGHHLLDPRTGRSPDGVASCTVVAREAMLADALSTAACILGPQRGVRWLERQAVAALIVTPDLERYETERFARVERCQRQKR